MRTQLDDLRAQLDSVDRALGQLQKEKRTAVDMYRCVVAVLDTRVAWRRSERARIVQAIKTASQRARGIRPRRLTCHSTDGDCAWPKCPQIRDGEPAATGRHCPLDVSGGDSSGRAGG